MHVDRGVRWLDPESLEVKANPQVRFVPRAERPNTPELSPIPMGVAGPGVETLLAVTSTALPHFAVSCAMIPLSSPLLTELGCITIDDVGLNAGDVRFPSIVAKGIPQRSELVLSSLPAKAGLRGNGPVSGRSEDQSFWLWWS
jgi:hypothetical protein